MGNDVRAWEDVLALRGIDGQKWASMAQYILSDLK